VYRVDAVIVGDVIVEAINVEVVIVAEFVIVALYISVVLSAVIAAPCAERVIKSPSCPCNVPLMYAFSPTLRSAVVFNVPTFAVVITLSENVPMLFAC
jgi:hypothetical protein